MNAKHCLFSLLLLASAPAVGATYTIGIGDDCDSVSLGGCFFLSSLTIRVGDMVEFYSYVDVLPTGPHNVVADDGSFRCGVLCVGEGGTGLPIGEVHFTRQFNAPGIVKYHDEAGGAAGVIIVMPLPVGPGFTGSWYDPAQNGHGFALQVIAGQPMRLFASWLTFAPQGGQSWIVALGPIDGDRAVLRGFPDHGRRWAVSTEFHTANVREEDWGTLTFRFSDCNHGHVDWAPTASGYTSGGMDLTRLTLPAGLSCP